MQLFHSLSTGRVPRCWTSVTAMEVTYGLHVRQWVVGRLVCGPLRGSVFRSNGDTISHPLPVSPKQMDIHGSHFSQLQFLTSLLQISTRHRLQCSSMFSVAHVLRNERCRCVLSVVFTVKCFMFEIYKNTSHLIARACSGPYAPIQFFLFFLFFNCGLKWTDAFFKLLFNVFLRSLTAKLLSVFLSGYTQCKILLSSISHPLVSTIWKDLIDSISFACVSLWQGPLLFN